MSNFLLSVYEHMRRQGVYETDWVDRFCWRLFGVFVIVLILI